MQALGLVELAGPAHAAQLLGQAHQDQPRVGDDREQHPAERIGLTRRQAASRRPLRAGAKLPEASELLGKDGRGFAECRGRLGARQEAAREQRLEQSARDDLALGVECGNDRRGLVALLSRGRPAVGLRRPAIERSAQFIQYGRAGGRSRGRRLHGEWLS